MNTPGFRSVQFRRLSSSSIAWISPIRLSKSKAFREPDQPEEPAVEPSDLRIRPKSMSEEETISAMRHSKDPQSALEVFNAAGEQKGSWHSTATYSMILHRLAHARKFKAVDAVLRQMTHEPSKFHEGPFMNLMTHFSRASMHEKVLEMFSAISEIGGEKPSRKAFTKCLNLLVEAGRVDLTRRLLLRTRKTRRLKPNTCVFNILVKHHCKAGDLSSAFAVVEEMRRSWESLPNVITYSVLMKSLCERGRLREAMELFERMIGEDKIKPDEFTYDVLIRGFCRGGDVGKGQKILEFMRLNGCEPNVFNYTALIDGLCKAGLVGEAEGVLHEMRSLGLKLDVIGYTVLIEGLCGTGRSGDALVLLKEMKRNRVRPNSVTFRAVLAGLCREGRFREALNILGRRIFVVNEAGHRVVMRALCDVGELKKALGVLKLTLERGFVPHFETTNVLLARLCAVGKVDDAVAALFGLIRSGFNPEPHSWALMVDFVSRERKLVAFRLLDQLIA